MHSIHLIKQRFLSSYASHDYAYLADVSLVPVADIESLFVNSALARLGAMLAGKEAMPARNLATCQRCLKVGGGHGFYGSQHDLEAVGREDRLSLFEQIAAFSFTTDPADAIAYAWNLLSGEFELNPERLFATIQDSDHELRGYWESVGMFGNHILPIRDAHWMRLPQFGLSGPITHCIYDRGADFVGYCGREECGPRCRCGRYLDLGDLIFLRSSAGAPVVIDTSFGVERLAAAIEGSESIFDVGPLAVLVMAVKGLASTQAGVDDISERAARAIADHVRCLVFAISDGVLPGKHAREYVLRRVLRHANTLAWQHGIFGPFLHLLVETVVQAHAQDYPWLSESGLKCQEIIATEEQLFIRSLSRGLDYLRRIIAKLPVGDRHLPQGVLEALRESYGVPMEISVEIARAEGIDLPGHWSN